MKCGYRLTISSSGTVIYLKPDGQKKIKNLKVKSVKTEMFKHNSDLMFICLFSVFLYYFISASFIHISHSSVK